MHFSTAADGKTRCLPHVTLGVIEAFADAACSTPLRFASTLRTYGCDDTRARFVRQTEIASCQTLSHIFGQGVRITNKVYTKTGTTCSALPDEERYTFGAELPASAFVEANLVTE